MICLPFILLRPEALASTLMSSPPLPSSPPSTPLLSDRPTTPLSSYENAWHILSRSPVIGLVNGLGPSHCRQPRDWCTLAVCRELIGEARRARHRAPGRDKTTPRQEGSWIEPQCVWVGACVRLWIGPQTGEEYKMVGLENLIELFLPPNRSLPTIQRTPISSPPVGVHSRHSLAHLCCWPFRQGHRFRVQNLLLAWIW